MAVKIRMKRMGRKHRSFWRICATDSRAPRDGRVIEELGTYDPSVPDTDARVTLNSERVKYWLGVGAQPSEKVHILIKKYAEGGTHVEQMNAARARLALPRIVPAAGPMVELPKKKGEEPENQTAPGPEGATQIEPAASQEPSS